MSAFGPRIRACDTNTAVSGEALPNVSWCDSDQLLRESDLVSVHIPLTRTNHHFLNRERIGTMKTGALLINTARGPVVDEKALEDALLQQHLGGAAIDVFESEPYEGPMARMDNVVLTAHIGASARASRFLMEMGAAEDCVRVLRGDPAQHDAIADWADVV